MICASFEAHRAGGRGRMMIRRGWLAALAVAMVLMSEAATARADIILIPGNNP